MGIKLGSIKLYWTKDKKKYFIGIPKYNDKQEITGLKYHIDVTEDIIRIMYASQNGNVREINGKYYRATIAQMTEEEVAQHLSVKNSNSGKAMKKFYSLMSGPMSGSMGGQLPDDFFLPPQLKKTY